ncbi:hypothetical protein KEM54_004026, partial [Ascosphaera aggregata]
MAAAPAPKKVKLSGPLIGTHSGQFHADEALAVYLLRKLPEYADSPLVRTRDPALLATCHTVVDVGGEYNPETNRYDHHQRSFTTTFPDRQTRLSSAGLVYMHFGEKILAEYMKLPQSHADLQTVYKKIYLNFIEAIDANDNGIQPYNPDELAAAGLEKRFHDGGLTVPALVRDMNMPNPDAPESQPQDEDSLFARASKFMGETFDRKLRWTVTSWLPACAVMRAAYNSRFDVHPSGRLIVLPGGGVPWKEHLYNLEEDYTKSLTEGTGDTAETSITAEKDKKSVYDPKKASPAEVFYVLYPESKDPDSKWRVQAASTPASAFESRLPLKESWRGTRDDTLDALIASEAQEKG